MDDEERAKILFKHQLAALRIRLRTEIQLAIAGLKILLLTTGGAVVVMMAFISNLWVKADMNASQCAGQRCDDLIVLSKQNTTLAQALTPALGWFIGAIALAMVTTFFAYCSQWAQVEGDPAENEYSQANPPSKFFRWIAVGVAFCSIFVFSVGARTAWEAFNGMAKSTAESRSATR